jgi:hypothetical protein
VDLLTKYREEIARDITITDFNIKEVSLKLPARKHFWAARLIDCKIELNNLQKQKKELKKAITKRLLEESQVRLTTQAAEIAAESTKELEAFSDNIKRYEFLIEYLEKVEKLMSSMHWEIKNIIDIQRLEQL